MKKYKETLIKEIEISDIDLDPPFYELNEEEPSDIEYDPEARTDDIPSISIEQVEEILEDLKKLGANRVYLLEHPDHQGYIFTGVNLKEIQ